MLNKIIQWFNRNSCKECDYYCPANNVCQAKKCALVCHPYVNWIDRHFCKAYKTESEDKE